MFSIFSHVTCMLHDTLSEPGLPMSTYEKLREGVVNRKCYCKLLTRVEHNSDQKAVCYIF